VTRGFTPNLQATESTVLKKRRELPIPGEITVNVGDLVSSDTVVGKAELPGELRIVRVSEELGLDPSDLMPLLCVKQGELVERGTLLASHKAFFGLFHAEVKSPVVGVVELISTATGHIAIRGAGKAITVDAYISGRVVEVAPKKGVVIETSCAWIQGIFGVGGERHGKLLILDIPNDTVVTEAHIPKDAKGSVLVGGMRPTLKALHTAASRGAVGLVTGSIDDKALAGYIGFDLGVAITGDEDLSMTVIITEGFGSLPISERILQILKPRQGALVSINGATQVRAGALRPEIIIEGKGEEHASNNEQNYTLSLGARVRLIRVPYFGEIGTITELPNVPEKIETGAVTRVARVELSDGRGVTVPRSNLEMV